MPSSTPVSTVYNLFLLDESGSMEVVRVPTFVGYDALVMSIEKLAEEFPRIRQLLGLTTFNGQGIAEHSFMSDPREQDLFILHDYQPRYKTPLYDAIGVSVTKLREYLKQTQPSSCRVLVTVLSDGEENASKAYTLADTWTLIDQTRAEGWTYVYIGTNHDVNRVADELGIANRLVFEQTEEGTADMFQTEIKARRGFTTLALGAPKHHSRTDYFAADPKPTGPATPGHPRLPSRYASLFQLFSLKGIRASISGFLTRSDGENPHS